MRLLTALLTIGVLTTPSLALSQQDRTAAEVAFREGRALMEEKRFAEACERFALSQRLDPAVGTLTNLGVCHEKLGKFASAWVEFNEAADIAAGNGQADRAAQIRKRAEALEPRLSRLSIETEGDQPGLRVTRDGADVGALVGTPVPVDPGTYVIEATAEGKAPWTRDVEVADEGETVTVTVPTLETVEVEETPADVKKSPGRNSRRLIALGIGIGGLTASGTGLYFGARARSKYSDSNQFCDDDNFCSEEGLTLRDSAFKNATISNVLIGVGVAAIVGAGVLWYLSPSASPADDKTTQVIPVAGPNQLGVMVQGAF